MFPGGEPDLGQLFQQAQQIQQQLAEAQQRIADARVTGTAGGGLVRATVAGSLELVDLVLDPAAVDPEDPQTLADLVLAAVRDAQHQAHELQQQALGGLPDLPDLPDLPGLPE